MSVLTVAEIKKSEENAVNSGTISFKELMHTAGKVAYEIINKKYNIKNKKIAVICGNGNNGGDGFVIARYLYENGANVTVITPMGVPKTENSTYYYGLLSPIKITDTLEKNYDIIIDSLFGIGLNRNLSNELKALIEKLNSISAKKIAIDIPSGVEADTGKILGVAFKADITITFIALKPCFVLPIGSDYCGEVIVADICAKPIDGSYKLIKKPHFNKRPHNCHKGTFGTALIITGSYGMAGAAILSAKAALRSGLGIAKCILGKSIYSSFTAALPEAVCLPKDENSSGQLSYFDGLSKLINSCDSVLFGCGCGISDDGVKILTEIIQKSTVPIVIDADGINMLSSCIELLKESKAPIILTPHPAEMSRLCGITVKEVENNRIRSATDFVLKNKCYLILKGANTIVATPNGEINFNLTGNSGMATGGSGDVLAGILVSLLAQGLSPENAVKAAVYLHGHAADKAAARRGQHAIIPSDIIEEL